MLFVVSDDLIGIDIFLLKFLVVTAALQGVAGLYVLSHGFVELIGSV